MKSLNFVHITKTGGSTIANVSRRAGLKWSQFNRRTLRQRRNKLQGVKGPIWHQPLYLFNPVLVDSFDWFCVIRDPVERCVSEFNCRWEGWQARNPKGKPTADNLNAFIQRSIERRIGHAHFHPQYRYIFDPGGRKIVRHVLLFENFVDEFNGLAKEYRIDARITSTDWANKRKSDELTTKDLTEETRELILDRYSLDHLIYERLRT